MANEWEVVELLGPNRDGEQRRYTIAAGTQVSIGTLMLLTDNRTVTKGDGAFAAVIPIGAGIAAEEHEADKGVTTLSCWTDGIFLGYLSGKTSVPIGGGVIAGGYNMGLYSAALTFMASGSVFGKAFEAVTTGGQGEVRVGPL